MQHLPAYAEKKKTREIQAIDRQDLSFTFSFFANKAVIKTKGLKGKRSLASH